MTVLMQSFRVDSDRVLFTALVPDAVQVAPATRLDPPSFGSALCSGWAYWDVDEDGDVLAFTDEQFDQLCQQVDNWVVISPDDL